MSFKTKLKFYLFKYGFYSLIYIAIILSAILNEKILEAVFFFIAYLAVRYKFPTTYHNKKFYICILLSILSFCICITLLIDKHTSILFTIVYAVAFDFLLYYIAKSEALKEEKLLIKPFSVETCTEEELIERCKLRFKRDVEYKTERAIKHFILKLPHNEIDINPEQSKKERYRFKKLLEK